MPTPSTDLRLFYLLCSFGVLATTFNLGFLTWLSIFPSVLSAIIVGAVLVAAYVVMRYRRRVRFESYAKQATHVTQDILRPRAKARLDALQTKLREFSHNQSAELVMVSDNAVVLSTLPTKDIPIVAMSAGFWSVYSPSQSMLEAAVAHEAGHIAAKDVMIFDRLDTLIRLISIVGLGSALLSLLWLQERPWIFLTLAIVLLSGAAIALSWSALISARELQADAWAAIRVGRENVSELLRRQLERRELFHEHSSRFQALRTWWIQPTLRWRVGLPILDARFGARIEFQLGLAGAGFVIAMILWPSLLSGLSSDLQSIAFTFLPIWAVWYFWISYRFLWERSSVLGGRTLPALGQSLLSWLRYSTPLFVFSVVADFSIARSELQLQQGIAPLGPADSLGLGLVFMLFLWATAKVVLLSRRERTRACPSAVRALVAIISLKVLTTIAITLGAAFLGFDPTAKDLLGPYNNLVVALATLAAGVAAHMFTPSANSADTRMRV